MQWIFGYMMGKYISTMENISIIDNNQQMIKTNDEAGAWKDPCDRPMLERSYIFRSLLSHH